MRKVSALILILLLLLTLPVTAHAAGNLEQQQSVLVTTSVPSEHTFTLEPVENAQVVLNGTAISGSLVLPRHSEMNLAIIPDPGYAIEKVYLNGEDVTGQVKGGFLTIEKLYENTSLQVITRQADQSGDSRRTYVCYGKVVLEGRPVQGATVQIPGIGSATTQRDGSFRIGRIPAGDWSFAVTKDGKLLGYVPFTLKVGYPPSCVVGADGNYVITVTRGALVEGFSITLDLSDSTKAELDRFRLEELYDPTNPKTGDYIMIAVAVLLLSGAVLTVLYKKKDRFLKDKDPE